MFVPACCRCVPLYHCGHCRLLCYVLLCLCLGLRACSGVGNVPLYHCGRCRLHVCLCCVSLSLQVASVSRSIIAAYAGFMLCFVCISLCVFEPARVQLGVGNVLLYHCGHCRLYVCLCCVSIVAIAGFMLCFVCVFLCVFGPARVQFGPGSDLNRCHRCPWPWKV